MLNSVIRIICTLLKHSEHLLRLLYIFYDQLNLNKHTAEPVDMLHDVELQDVKISHTQTMLLITLSRRLFLFSTKTDRKLRSIEKLPDGVFIGIKLHKFW